MSATFLNCMRHLWLVLCLCGNIYLAVYVLYSPHSFFLNSPAVLLIRNNYTKITAVAFSSLLILGAKATPTSSLSNTTPHSPHKTHTSCPSLPIQILPLEYFENSWINANLIQIWSRASGPRAFTGWFRAPRAPVTHGTDRITLGKDVCAPICRP